MSATDRVSLAPDSNQALGIAQFAIDFMERGAPAQDVLDRTDLFHTDAVVCGLSALALRTNAPTVLRDEALQYAVPAGDNGPGLGRSKHHGATVFGSSVRVKSEKAIVANCAAVREWDSNGTNFGFRPELGHTAGEFGHNDFYAVPLAAAQMLGADGTTALKGMVLHDEIRGRLAEVFSLKTYKIDHVLHGAIASAATFGAMIGATAEQIESAIGMVVAHAVPFRAIRAGKQLSDSKGSSAAISTEFAILALKRSMAGFMGPRDIFRNPEAVFRMFEGPGQMFTKVNKDGSAEPANHAPADASPFELVLSMSGSDFTIMGMHFKLGLYEHQSAGASQAVIDLIRKQPSLLDDASGGKIGKIKVVAYEPAFGIIGDPAKRSPTTRQSADHSMVFIISRLLAKALKQGASGSNEDVWKGLMLEPADYGRDAIADPFTKSLMDKIEFEHGGDEYDRNYPDGIPTSVVITDDAGGVHDSGMVMYPAGHARNTEADLHDILGHKFRLLGGLAADNADAVVTRYEKLGGKSADEIQTINDLELTLRESVD
ncbi:MAG: MmgE/PrpD family protein [Planctomycetota bacterium]